jgi:hypothetical protein
MKPSISGRKEGRGEKRVTGRILNNRKIKDIILNSILHRSSHFCEVEKQN